MVDRTGRALRKVVRRLIPILFTGSIMANLDRSNVGMAALQMNQDVGLSPSVYGFGVGAFFVAYALFEVPSNLWLVRFGARRWLTRIMLTWGIISGASALIVGPVSFTLNRVALGVAEAGYLPGALAFIATWIPPAHRARIFSYFLLAVPIAVVVGGPLAALLLQLDGMLGLRGWQWIFVMEGLPPIIIGALMWRILRDRPTEAEWLTPEEAATLSADSTTAAAARKPGAGDMMRALLTPVVFLATAVLSTLGGINQAVTFWLPQIVRSAGLTTVETGFLSSVPYAFGAIAMLLWSRHSDQTQERRWHLAGPAICAGLAIASSAFASGLVGRFMLITLTMTCLFATQAVFWTAVSTALPAAQRTVAMAVINAGGTLLAFLAPSMIGISKQLTGKFDVAFVVLGALGIIGGLMALALSRYIPRSNLRPVS